MSFHIDDDKLLEKYKIIWIKTEDLQYFEFNTLLVYDDRYLKNKIRTYGNNVFINFRGLNVTKDSVECEYLIIISLAFLLVYDNKYYLQIYLDNCGCKL